MRFQSTHPSGVRLELSDWLVLLLVISIHAPQWGATVHDAAAESFQSISIHAPQWGATHGRQYISQSRTHFNPRTPVGCDVYDYSNAETAELFQSTHPSGVRPA